MAIINTKADQERLRRSGLILGSCLHHLGTFIKPGINAAVLNKFAHDFILSYDSSPSFLNYQGFPHVLCTSLNEEVVHGLSTESKIFKSGDIVSFDLGVNYEGLITDAALTFLINDEGSEKIDFKDSKIIKQADKTSPKLFSGSSKLASTEDKIKLIARTKQALQIGINVLKAGIKTGNIGQAINDYIQTFGYGNVTALGGHGVGREVHEEPYISHVGKKGEGRLLVENMVIALEPMITLGPSGKVSFKTDPIYRWDEVVTLDSSLAAHFEHTILITKKGCEILTEPSLETLLPVK